MERLLDVVDRLVANSFILQAYPFGSLDTKKSMDATLGSEGTEALNISLGCRMW